MESRHFQVGVMLQQQKLYLGERYILQSVFLHYAPCDTVKRRKLWQTICNIKPLFTGPWCLGGDLIEVRYINERQGCTIRDRGMKDLSRFIEDMELIDRYAASGEEFHMV